MAATTSLPLEQIAESPFNPRLDSVKAKRNRHRPEGSMTLSVEGKKRTKKQKKAREA